MGDVSQRRLWPIWLPDGLNKHTHTVHQQHTDTNNFVTTHGLPDTLYQDNLDFILDVDISMLSILGA